MNVPTSGTGHQAPQYTAGSSAPIMDSEIILDSATLPQSSSGLPEYRGPQAPSTGLPPPPSGGSVIDSEIIIPDEEPIQFSNVYDASDYRDPDPPIIHHDDRDRGFRGDSYILANRERERRPPPFHSYKINTSGNYGGPQYNVPPPQNPSVRGLEYTIPPPQNEPKKVPLDQMSGLGKPSSTIVIYESGPSNQPLPQKVDQPVQKPGQGRLRDRRCFCCFMVFLIILLFLIVIALAVVIPLLRLYE